MTTRGVAQNSPLAHNMRCACAGSKPSCYLLVEDVPVQALDALEAEVIAEDHLKPLFAFYSHLEELYLFRTISCVIVSYSQADCAKRVSLLHTLLRVVSPQLGHFHAFCVCRVAVLDDGMHMHA